MTKTPPPDVSVVIPCFNAARTIGAQLEALSSQQDAPSFEVLLVDNRSTDDLHAAVAPFTGSDRFLLRLLDASEHQGASYARNVGIREASADRIMFCDADDIVGAWWIRNGLEAFDRTPLWTGAVLLLTDEVFEQGLESVRDALGESPHRPQVEDSQKGAFPVLTGGNFGATRDALLAVGGFDQSLPTQGEDNDFGFRARRLGFRVESASGVKIGYRGRWDPSTRARLAYGKARAHALIVTRYDAWAQSHYNRWWAAPIRWIFDGIVLRFRSSQKQRDDWTIRGGAVRGFFWGAVQFRILGRRPAQQIGLGWLDHLEEDPREAA